MEGLSSPTHQRETVANATPEQPSASLSLDGLVVARGLLCFLLANPK